jgi:AmiR/NasT family two-component response regulator
MIPSSLRYGATTLSSSTRMRRRTDSGCRSITAAVRTLPASISSQSKGILMERHAIDEAGAFEMLRQHSRVANRKVIDLAAAIVDGHRLLPKQPQPQPPPQP